MAKPPVQYADSRGAEIAYCVAGAGRQDLVIVPPSIWTIDGIFDPPATRLTDELTSFARVISFDRRGSGLSGPAPSPPPLEEQLADFDAVLNAARCKRAALFAELEGCQLALLYAATRPQRVSHLVLLHGMARVTAAEDYEWPWSASERSQQLEPMLANWGKGETVNLFAPILCAEDPLFEDWYRRLERVCGTPSEMRAILELVGQMDVRGILPEVEVPTLVLNRPDAAAIDDRHAEYLAERIPGARLEQLPGRDAISIGDGFEETIAVAREFVTGERASSRDRSRSLATVLFTDIVGSTERAAELGDADWREILKRHEALTRALVERHDGRPIKSTGDGFLAVFDGPAQGVRCAIELCARIPELGIELRAGLHTGEVEWMEEDIGGMAVHIGARVSALAGAGEVLVSSTVRELVVGSGIAFEDAGTHELKGVREPWRISRALSEAGGVGAAAR